MRGQVYAVETSSCIRIGQTGRSPFVRRNEVQSGNPEEWEVSWYAPGNRGLERQLFKEFGHLRIHPRRSFFQKFDPVSGKPTVEAIDSFYKSQYTSDTIKIAN